MHYNVTITLNAYLLAVSESGLYCSDLPLTWV